MESCSFEGCGKAVHGHGYCSTHYQRWKSHGDASTVLKPYGRQSKSACGVGECDLRVVAREMCGKHYQRWKKYGDPLIVKMDKGRTLEDRFWSKVDKNGPVPAHRPDLGPCWVWTGGLAEGYGVFSIKGRQVKAHIVAFTWIKGEIEEDQERDHLCRNRACVNAERHLEAVTHWTNVARGTSPHGKNAAKTHCPEGHPYDEANTRINAKGSRVCIKCARIRGNRWYQKNRAANREQST